MPAVLRFNSSADDGRLRRLAAALGFSTAQDLANGLEELLCKLDIPKVLKEHGVTLSALEPLTSEMIAPGRSDNNLRPATSDDISLMLGEYVPEFLGQT